MNKLPNEILVSIFSYLDPLECFYNINLVCKRWNIILNDNILWKIYFKKYFGIEETKESNQITYKSYLYYFKNVYVTLNNLKFKDKLLYIIKNGYYKYLLNNISKNIENLKNDEILKLLDDKNHSLHQIAILNNNIETLNILISFNILLLNHFDNNGYNAVHSAVKLGNIKILNILLPNCISDICISNNKYKLHPIHIASENGHVNTLELLLQFSKSSINIISSKGETPLHLAARSGHMNCVNCLLQNNADPSIHNKIGKPSDYAIKSGYNDLALFIDNFKLGEYKKKQNTWHEYFGGEYELLTKRYLQWMIDSHKELILPGIEQGNDIISPHIKLESVYLSLKVDRAGSYEKLQAFKRLEQQVAELESKSDRKFNPEEKHAAVISQLIWDPSNTNIQTEGDSISLGQCFQSERGLVVLGDPGGGKTTLARWIALQLASTLKEKKSRVLVAASHVDVKTINTRRSDSLIDIGVTRLPILIRVADFAEYLDKNRKILKNTNSINGKLADYLGYHPWQGSYPSYNGVELCKSQVHELILDSLKKGYSVIIVDGLDEVANPQQRCEVVSYVDEFIWKWIYGYNTISYDNLNDETKLQYIAKALTKLGKPIDKGGNQIIITSRIAGYHSAPMKSPLTHVIIQPMNSISIQNFCNNWMIAAFTLEHNDNSIQVNIHKKALREAKKLYNSIENNTGVKKLAQNPLLLTILALVFRKSSNSIPKIRAQLYHVAMSILVNVWRSCSLTLDEIIDILAPLAEYLHENRPMGLISEEHLIEFLVKTRIDHNIDNIKHKIIQKNVEDFVLLISEQVGFLVARGESMYGFLHQSFQEYLAGWNLIEGKIKHLKGNKKIKQAANNLLKHVGDVRWKEPLLLALGTISELWDYNSINKLMNYLVLFDKNESAPIPRASLIIIEAWKEMKIIPIEIAQTIIIMIIYSYSKQNKYKPNTFESIRYRIECSMKDIISIRKDILLKVLINLFNNPKEILKESLYYNNNNNNNNNIINDNIISDCCCAAADLIDVLLLFSKDLFKSLLNAKKYDNKQWNWIIHKCIRRFISPKFSNDVSDKSLGKPYITLKIKNKDIIEQYFNSKYIKARVYASLFGGFCDFNVIQSTFEYYNYVTFLNRDNFSSGTKIENSLCRWTDTDDVRYNIAVHLDTFIPRNYWKIQPKFSISSIHCIPKLYKYLSKYLLDPNLLSILKYILFKYPEEDLNYSKLYSKLNLLSKDDIYNIKTEALISLIGFGEYIEDLLYNKSLNTFMNSCNFNYIECTLNSFKDPTARASYYIKQDLQKVFKKYKSYDFEQIFLSVITIITKAKNVLDIETLTGALWSGNQFSMNFMSPSATKRNNHIVFALYLLNTISSYNTDDRLYSIATCMDVCLMNTFKKYVPHSLALLPQLKSRIAPNLPLCDIWPICSPCSPIWDENEPLPIESLTVLENISYSWFIEEMIHVLALEIIPKCPDVEIELAITHLACVDHQTGSNTIINNIIFKDLDCLLKDAKQIKDPYYRSRTLIRFGEYFPELGDTISEALDSAMEIKDIHRKVVILEKIMELLPSNKASTLFLTIYKFALEIPNIENCSRALARLSLSPFCKDSTQLINIALNVALTIDNLSQLSCLLHDIRIVIERNNIEEEKLLFNDKLKIFKNPRYYDYANGNYGHVLIDINADLITSDSWWVTSLYGLFLDALNHLPLNITSNINHWDNLLDDKKYYKAFKSLCIEAVAPNSKGLHIDTKAIRTLDLLLEKVTMLSSKQKIIELYDIIYNILYYAGDISPTIRNYLSSWIKLSSLPLFNKKDKDINDKQLQVYYQISLICVEQQVFSIDTLEPILYLIQYGDDRSRIRAELALIGPDCYTSNAFRRWKTSQLGLPLLTLLAEAAWNATINHSPVGEIIRWMIHDLVHDSSEITLAFINKWLQAKTQKDKFIASFWLLKNECCTQEVWNIYLEYLEANKIPIKLQISLLSSVCKTATTAKYCSANWPKNAFEQLSKVSFSDDLLDKMVSLQDWPGSIAIAALETLKYHSNKSINERITFANNFVKKLSDNNSIRKHLTSSNTLAEFGDCYYFKLLSSYPGERTVPAAVEKLMKQPEILSQIIIPWMEYSLSQEQSLDITLPNNGRKVVALLEIAAKMSELLPATFQNYATKNLAKLLAKQVQENRNTCGRIAAIELLSNYGHIFEETIIALKSAILDNFMVSDRALMCSKKFRALNYDLLQFLLEELYNPIPSVSLTAGNILSGIYSSTGTTSEQREIILKGLTSAIKDPRIKNKYVFTVINTGKKSAEKYAIDSQISCLGSLEESLFLALSSVCGYSSFGQINIY